MASNPVARLFPRDGVQGPGPNGLAHTLLPPEFRLFSDVLAAPVLMQCLPRVLPAYLHLRAQSERLTTFGTVLCVYLCAVEIRADQGWLWGEGYHR